MCEQQPQKEIAASPHSPSVLRLGATDLLSPHSTPNPAAVGCNSDWAQYSNTPATPTPLFEHSLSSVATALSCTPLKIGLASGARSTTGLGRRRKHERQTPNAEHQTLNATV
jgi:hypothetical protein